jgi:hypothetical protein
VELEEFLNPKVLVPLSIVIVLVVGVGVGITKVLGSRGKAGMLEKWCRGAYGLWTGGEDCGQWDQARAQAALRDWYGATAVGSFWDVIGGLRNGQTASPAWDRVRALDLLRIGTAATYIDADSCWTEAGKIATELQARYRSWDELAQDFEAGMHAWQRSRGVTDPQQTSRVQRNLPNLRQQIWPQVPFHAKVVDDD